MFKASCIVQKKSRWFSVFAFLTGLFLASSSAFSAPPPVAPAPAPAPSSIVSDVSRIANGASLYVIGGTIDRALGGNLVQNFKTSGLSIASGLMGGAKILGGALALAALLWEIILALIKGESTLPATTECLLYAVVTAALLGNYTQIVNDIVGLGTWLIGATGKTLGTATHDFIQSIYTKLIDVIVKAIENMSTINIVKLSASLIDAVIAIFLIAIAAFFMIISLVELIGVVLAGPVVIGIAVALGPLFVATLASSWTRRWFSQWINFLVNGAMLTGLVVVVLMLVTGFITLNVGAPSSGYLSGEALMLALLAAGMGKIFSAIPSMADGLFPGRTSAGSASAGAKVISAAAQTAKGAATGAGAGAVAGGKAVASAGREVTATARVIQAANRMSNLGMGGFH